MIVSDILNKAADLIAPNGAWVQTSTARDINEMDVEPSDPSAVCWCLYGAVVKASGNDEAFRGAWSALKRGPAGYSPISFSDTPGRTQSEVVTALREAAKRAAK